MKSSELHKCSNAFSFFIWPQIKDVTRNIKKAVVAASLDEIRAKSAEKFGKSADAADLPNIHLDSDGTEVDDEDYFQTLEANAELIAVFPGEQWMDVSLYIEHKKKITPTA